jgi:hypothetical protein
MKPNRQSKIEKATVTLIENVAKGVLIENNMILTASHCVNYSLAGDMDLESGENYFEEIDTWSGKLKVAPIAIELISDIAVLGSMDDQEYYSDYEQFEYFCRNTVPVRVSKSKLVVNEKFKVFIYTHEMKWISGFAYISTPGSHILLIDLDEPIKRGTSGSGIYDEKGELLGIVSKTSLERNFGMATRPLLTLPLWICRQI